MTLRTPIAAWVWLTFSTALAQDTAPEKKAEPAAQNPPAQTTPENKDSAAAAKDEEDTAPPPAAPAKAGKDGAGSPQRFIPSEQVRSDFDVSFPVDI